MKRYLLIFLFLLLGTAQGEIYKWVDAQGNVHYADQPDASNARRMNKLPGLSTYAPPPVPESAEQMSEDRDEPAKNNVVEPQAKAFSYREIKIVSPEDGGAVRSSPGTVTVFVALAPVLREGDFLMAILDGQELEQKYQSTILQLENVDRGEHTLAVAVYDRNGRKLLQSAAHTFQLHRTIVRRAQPR